MVASSWGCFLPNGQMTINGTLLQFMSASFLAGYFTLRPAANGTMVTAAANHPTGRNGRSVAFDSFLIRVAAFLANCSFDLQRRP